MEVDPHFILGVSRNDSMEVVTREFKKRIRKVHPDKIQGSQEDKDNAALQFKLFMDAYETIQSKFSKPKTVGVGLRQQFKQEQEKNKKDVTQVNFNQGDVDKFNKEYTEKRPNQPNDFGYGDYNRLGHGKSDDDWKGRMNEYNSYSHTPVQVLNPESFSSQDFNKLFEYNNESMVNNEERGLVHKTTDGFSAFNSGGDNIASVSSFNGLMITGDNFGQGVGYDTRTFADYKQSHNGAQNPDKGTVPVDYRTKMDKYTQDDSPLERRIKERELEFTRLLSTKHDKSYGEQNREFELLQSQNLQNKIENDTKFIEQFSTMYSPELVEQARRGTLKTSTDYINSSDPLKSIDENYTQQQAKYKLQL